MKKSLFLKTTFVLIFSVFIFSKSLNANTTLPQWDKISIPNGIEAVQFFLNDIRCDECNMSHCLKYHGYYDSDNKAYFILEKVVCDNCGAEKIVHGRYLVSELGEGNLVII